MVSAHGGLVSGGLVSEGLVSSGSFVALSSTLAGLAVVSDVELDRRALALASGERRSTALVIAHLAEIDRRRVYLSLGYSCLFDYAVRRLALGESCAMLRIQVARACLKFPQILQALREGRVSLSVAALLSPVASGENIDQLLGRCVGLKKREAEEVVVEVAPRKVLDGSVRKKPRGQDDKLAQPDILAPSPSCFPSPSPQPASSPAQVTPATSELYNFRFAAPRSFKDALVRLGEVLGIPNPLKNAARVLEQALRVTLEAKDPARRLERREKRKNAARAPRAKTTPPPPPPPPAPATDSQHRPDDVPPPPASLPPRPSRHVPLALRDRVFSRAGHRCQYVAPDGTRCPGRTGLQVEHREPFAVSHNHSEDNLEALCAAHNGLRAREYFGSERIRQAIANRPERAMNPSASTAAIPTPTSSRTMFPAAQHRLDDV